MSRFAFLCALLACTSALAQPAQPPAEPAPAPAPAVAPTPPAAPTPSPDEQAATVHVTQGEALFNDGNYAAALAEFEAAYKLRPAPFMLNDIGLAQQKLFRYAEAIASLQQFLAQGTDVAPDARARVETIIRELQSLLADVTLTISPGGAQVSVDGRAIGTSPLGKLALPAGPHTLEVTAEGFTARKKEIIVAARMPVTLAIDLVAIPKTGKVHITSTTAHARIAVDGHDAGVAPLDLELIGGGHSVEVSAPNYRARHDEVLVTIGQTRVLDISLELAEQPRSWYQKWYVVTPLALAIAGIGGGLAINFGTHQGPLQGSLGAGQAR